MNRRVANIIQWYVAVVSVGASTVRGSRRGTADVARVFLARMHLGRLGVGKQNLFQERLDDLTEELRRTLPRGSQHWGLARKVLNIFLHNAFYNYYLRREHGLEKAEAFFEVPIDSAVAKGIRRAVPAHGLPTWRGLKHLEPPEHALYQKLATRVARQNKMSRVHLDALLWPSER